MGLGIKGVGGLRGLGQKGFGGGDGVGSFEYTLNPKPSTLNPMPGQP